MTIRTTYNQKLLVEPNPKVQAAKMKEPKAMVLIRLGNPCHQEIKPPPKTNPTEKAISIADNRHTSSPYVLVTTKVGNIEAGAISNMKIPKKMNRFLRKSWFLT